MTNHIEEKLYALIALLAVCLIAVIYVLAQQGFFTPVTNFFSSFKFGSAQERVLEDSISQYYIVKRSGNDIEACVYAGLVKAAAVQAKNIEAYDRWSRTHRMDCDNAGLQP